MDRPARATVLQGGRRKAYRPLPPAARAAALRAGLEAYGRGDFFEAHEVLEPAWMGTDDPAERDLYQGLIKLSAAFVHAVRGNPRGVEKNLRGARERLARAGTAKVAEPIDVVELVRRIEAKLAGEPVAASGGAASGGAAGIPIPRLDRAAISPDDRPVATG